jgi:hypothetical protein
MVNWFLLLSHFATITKNKSRCWQEGISAYPSYVMQRKCLESEHAMTLKVRSCKDLETIGGKLHYGWMEGKLDTCFAIIPSHRLRL